jgi:hypothetical protein
MNECCKLHGIPLTKVGNFKTPRCRVCTEDFIKQWKTKSKHLPRLTKNCAECGKEFTHVASDKDRRHCSAKCGFKKEVPLVQLQCPHCKNMFFPRRQHRHVQQFCSRKCACTNRNFDRKLSLRSQGIYADSRDAKRALLREQAACFRCGWSKYIEVLEIHHVDRDRKNNHIANLELICPNCHAVEHFLKRDGQFKNNLGLREEGLCRSTKNSTETVIQ